MRRWFVLTSIAVAVAALLPPSIFAATKNTAEFLSGTAKGIPENAVGALDASDSAQLRFVYGKSVFAVPYQSITDAQMVDPPGKRLWKVPMPRLARGSRYLTITYRDGDNPLMVTFKAPASEISDLVGTIEERRKGPQSAAAKPTLNTTPEEWWGDRYWRTNRNKAKWPAPEVGDAPGVPAGTKY